MARTNNNSKALAAFMARKAEIDAMLERIKAKSDEHFDCSPDDIHWGHAGDLDAHATLLKRITDALYHEGEFAPE